MGKVLASVYLGCTVVILVLLATGEPAPKAGPIFLGIMIVAGILLSAGVVVGFFEEQD